MFACFLGSLVTLLAAAVVLWLTWWAVYGTIWFILLSFTPPKIAIVISTWVVFVLLFVAYFAANWPEVEKTEFESPAKLRVARVAAIMTDSPYLVLLGPPQFDTFVRGVAVVSLIGPAMTMMTWKVLQQAGAAWKGSPDHVAAVLKRLAQVGVRMPLEELIGVDQENRAPRTFAAVRLFDGVIFRSTEPVGLVLTEGLRNEIIAIAPTPVKLESRPSTAKPPAGRVSSPSVSPVRKPAAAAPPPSPPKSVPKPPAPKPSAPPPDLKRKPRP